MAHPYIFEDNFEEGSGGIADTDRFDSEQDGGSQLDIVHYTTLAQSPGLPMPWNGAYCARWQLRGGSADATFTEADMNIADTATAWFKWNMWVSPDFVTRTTVAEGFTVFELQGAANVVTFAFGLGVSLTNNNMTWAAGELTPASGGGEIPLGKWFTVELKCNVETGGSGEIEVYITPEGEEPPSSANQTVGSITNIAATHGVLGVQDHLSTTYGTILMDNFVMDDERIYPDKDRFSTERQVTQSQHLFVGPGTIDNITLFDAGGAGDAVLKIFDTDTAQTYQQGTKAYVKTLTSSDTERYEGVPVRVTRGCYVDLSGTTPEAFISFTPGANWYSDGNIRQFAHRRKLGG